MGLKLTCREPRDQVVIFAQAYPVRYAEDKRGRERSSRTTGPLRTKDL
jgi:hypothetical protein